MTFIRRIDSTLRASLVGLVVCSASLVGSAALAAQINLPDSNAVDYSTFERRPVDLSLAPQGRQAATSDQPATNFLGTKLNFTDGQIQLFRFRLDKVPFNSTLPQQQIDAGGIKLKWNW